MTLTKQLIIRVHLYMGLEIECEKFKLRIQIK
ncbi:hypothetical protein DZA65_02847 [Dickeya dianthicola]|jgi:hypothetical protein|nr:hypothetical protein DZA65_02847 [Dickeya dianthicola]CAI1548153.1 Uncharacterised protein [Serratia plymuthica]